MSTRSADPQDRGVPAWKFRESRRSDRDASVQGRVTRPGCAAVDKDGAHGRKSVAKLAGVRLSEDIIGTVNPIA
jgi:hypothetical protein